MTAKKGQRKGKRKAYNKVARVIRPGFLSIKKTFYLGIIQARSTADLTNAGSWAFQLNNNGELTQHAALYDQYRICAAGLKMTPSYTDTSPASAGQAPVAGQVFTYFDWNDASVPNNTAEVLNKQRYKQHRTTQSWREYIKGPRTAGQVYQTATTSGYEANGPNKWISTANVSVPHYGWKWFAENMGGNAYVQVWCTLYVQFKDPK